MSTVLILAGIFIGAIAAIAPKEIIHRYQDAATNLWVYLQENSFHEQTSIYSSLLLDIMKKLVPRYFIMYISVFIAITFMTTYRTAIEAESIINPFYKKSVDITEIFLRSKYSGNDNTCKIDSSVNFSQLLNVMYFVLSENDDVVLKKFRIVLALISDLIKSCIIGLASIIIHYKLVENRLIRLGTNKSKQSKLGFYIFFVYISFIPVLISTMLLVAIKLPFSVAFYSGYFAFLCGECWIIMYLIENLNIIDSLGYNAIVIRLILIFSGPFSAIPDHLFQIFHFIYHFSVYNISSIPSELRKLMRMDLSQHYTNAVAFWMYGFSIVIYLTYALPTLLLLICNQSLRIRKLTLLVIQWIAENGNGPIYGVSIVLVGLGTIIQHLGF
jgi:hypothetical protein